MMSYLALGAVLVVAAAHLGFLVLETFLWTTPTGRKIFALSAADAETTKVLAQNQGVYNGVLGASLAWAALADQPTTVMVLLVFVLIVGVYGGLTAKWTILLLQALPAAVALALVWLAAS